MRNGVMETDKPTNDTKKDNNIGIIKEHRISLILFGLIIFLKIGASTGLLSKGWKILIVTIAAILGFPALLELMNSRFTFIASIAWIVVMLWVFFGGVGILAGY